MRDYVCQRVRLLKDMETEGGTKFHGGEILRCYGTWNGKLHLQDEHNRHRSIRCVSRYEVEIVEADQTK